MTTTTTPTTQYYLTIRRQMNALRDEQFRILTRPTSLRLAQHAEDKQRYNAIEAEIEALRQKLTEAG